MKMAHEVESMMSVHEVPWHGLGTILDNPPTIEEGIQCAGLDWEVKLEPLVLKNGGLEVPASATVRTIGDKTDVLGVVGPRYTPIQNREAFAFFQPFLDGKVASLETAGSLRNGQRVWVLAKVAHSSMIDVVPGDSVERFILLSNSHDGSQAARVGLTATRVVCANTLAVAHSSSASKLLKVRHTKNANEALNIVREVMQIADQEFLATAAQWRQLAKFGVTQKTLKAYVRRVFDPQIAEDASDAEIAEKSTCARVLPDIIRLFESGAGADLPGVKGTMWCAYNAITEYLTHERGRSADIRLDSLWFGPGQVTNQRALQVGLKMAAYG
jgi:phage/plasmid-like protein (TIGR03299 family)